jgi:hypothetical protein
MAHHYVRQGATHASIAVNDPRSKKLAARHATFSPSARPTFGHRRTKPEPSHGRDVVSGWLAGDRIPPVL